MTASDFHVSPLDSPLGPRQATFVWLAPGILVAAYGLFACIRHGSEAILRSDNFPVEPGEAIVAFALALVLLKVGLESKHRRYFEAAVYGTAGLALICLLIGIPRGPHSNVWLLMPSLVVALGSMLSLTSGLILAVATAIGALVSGWLQFRHAQTPQADTLTSAMTIGAALLAAGLLAAFLQARATRANARERQHRRWAATTTKALRHRERLLRHAMRLDTVGSMTSMVSHELRNQVQLMLGNASMGLLAEGLDKDVRLQRVQESATSTAILLDQLMRLAHPGSEVARMVDVVAEVRRIAETLRQVLPDTIRFEIDLPSEPLTARLDSLGLEQTLLNLVINARQAMDDNGLLEIRVERAGSQGVIHVGDSGTGIAPHVLPNIFKPFFTTKPAGVGTGLGLAAVQRYVMSMDGQIDVTTEVGRGSQFHLSFPLAESPRLLRESDLAPQLVADQPA